MKTTRERFEEKFNWIDAMSDTPIRPKENIELGQWVHGTIYQGYDLDDVWEFIEQEIANSREEALKEWEERGRIKLKEDMYDKLSEWHWTWIAMLDDYFKRCNSNSQ